MSRLLRKDCSPILDRISVDQSFLGILISDTNLSKLQSVILTMLPKSLLSIFLLPAAIRAAAVNSTSTLRACNSSPSLCSRRYNEVTYL
jgi:hypothetical protein